MLRSKRLGIELYPGTVFIYKMPRSGWLGLGKRSYAIGEVLAVDETHGIVHVRTLKSNAETGPKVDINHIPVLFRQLVRDLVEIVGKASPDVESWASINDFRRRHAAGEVGAFAGRLWKAEALARKALPKDQERTPIRHTFVKRRDGDGPLSVVEVSV
ncbi:MAG: hypothetical protein AAGC67_00790 [Myxococcota bacterium]